MICPYKNEHTPQPEGQKEWSLWARGMWANGYRQKKCNGCGLLMIWYHKKDEESKSKKPISIFSQLQNTKIVVLLEVEPLSDRFEPVLLTYPQLTGVVDLIESYMPHDGNNFQIITNSAKKVKITDVREYYSPEEIVEHRKKGSFGTSN